MYHFSARKLTLPPKIMAKNDESSMRIALISVSDKTGISGLATELHELGFLILSTGGTARAIEQSGIPVTGVSQHTGFSEIMDGRVKTLHPKIHGGILGRDTDRQVMKDQGIDAIELVVVNLYPFASVTAKPDCSLKDAIENIDIGGPAMVRAAAKNHARVTVVTDPGDYDVIVSELKMSSRVSGNTRFNLAAKAFAHTAQYDSMIAAYLAKRSNIVKNDDLPEVHSPSFTRKQNLRYGENPHQSAALYSINGETGSPHESAHQLQGKELSYNNIADADAALECARQFTDRPSCIIVKHANPCGGASADTLLEAYDSAYSTDPVSSFGGIIAMTHCVDAITARTIVERQFVEVVIAPAYSEDALTQFAAKPNVRVMTADFSTPTAPRIDYHRVSGGLLIQEHDILAVQAGDCRCVTERQASAEEINDMMFAWKMVRLVKSNAIVYATNDRTLGIGAGQMSRVDSARIAAWKAKEAGLSLAGSAMASDAFFPFRDSIDAAAATGVKCIIQPGGSMRDEEVIAAANEHGITMLFTGHRHFRH
ncbi:MAG: phosphoribosylaminoimidazolecarboxamide formyltransferase/IMP cyclohydrolase [Lysobacterales bacterium]